MRYYTRIRLIKSLCCIMDKYNVTHAYLYSHVFCSCLLEWYGNTNGIYNEFDLKNLCSSNINDIHNCIEDMLHLIRVSKEM